MGKANTKLDQYLSRTRHSLAKEIIDLQNENIDLKLEIFDLKRELIMTKDSINQITNTL